MENDVVFQILHGIDHIHKNKLTHGDLNPTTIVISTQFLPARIKISDFGLRKLSYTAGQSDEGETSTKFSELCKMKYWRLKENDADESTLELVSKPTEEADDFAVGCLLFYFLTRGDHPFGDTELIHDNMKAGYPVKLNSELLVIWTGIILANYVVIFSQSWMRVISAIKTRLDV